MVTHRIRLPIDGENGHRMTWTHDDQVRQCQQVLLEQGPPESHPCTTPRSRSRSVSNLGILAPNGTGKTTLVNMMAGSGETRSRAASYPARPNLVAGRLQWWCGADHVGGGEHPLSSPGSMIGIRMRCWPSASISPSLDHYIDMPVRTYSSGMRSRLSLCAADGDRLRFLPGGRGRFGRRQATSTIKAADDVSRAVGVFDPGHGVAQSPETLKQYCEQAAVLMDGTLHMFDSLEEAKELYEYE